MSFFYYTKNDFSNLDDTPQFKLQVIFIKLKGIFSTLYNLTYPKFSRHFANVLPHKVLVHEEIYKATQVEHVFRTQGGILTCGLD